MATVPDGLRYTKDHEWVKVEGAELIVGITEFAQSELGDIVFVDLPAPGKKLEAGKPMCVVESTKAASDVYAPVAGVVASVNAALTDSPATANSSPYAEGWMVRLREWKQADVDALMTAEQYRQHIRA